MRKRTQEEYIQDFWDAVEIKGDDECWEWKKSRDKCGYGQYGDLKSHRISWSLKNGPIQEGKKILHKCDNPPCCNPAHLFVGTQADNVADMIKKGRYRTAPAKLTPDDVRFIKYYYHELRDSRGLKRLGHGRAEALLSIYDIDMSVITRITQGKDWASVK